MSKPCVGLLKSLVRGLCALCVTGPLLAWGASDSVGDPDRTDSGRQLIVQITGRFCEYQRADVKAALADVWSVEYVEFVNDQGTIRVFYDGERKARSEVTREVERALSLGWFCTARVPEPGDQEARPIGLLQVRR